MQAQVKKTSQDFAERLELLRLKCKKATVLIAERLNEDLRILLNRDCSVNCPGPVFQAVEQMAAEFARDRDFWASTFFDKGPQEAKLMLHIPFPLGVVFSGVVIVMADNRIREKIEEMQFTDEDFEVLEEVVNQLRGSLMRALRKAAHRDLHLVQEYVIQMSGIPEPIPSGYACVIPLHLNISRLIETKLQIILDLQATAELFGLELPKSELDELFVPEQAPDNGKDTPQDNAGAESPRAVVIEGTEEGRVLRPILRAAGFEVVDFDRVQQLSEQLERGEIDVVLIDSGENVMKAIRLAQMLRSFSRTCTIVVGANQWKREMIFQGVRAGINGFLTKPYEAAAVVQKLGKTGGKGREGSEIVTTEATAP